MPDNIENIDFPWLHWSDPLTWYILTVSPLCERLVAKRMRYKMIEVVSFVPMARFEVRRRGNRYDVERVVFPGYLFVGFRRVPPWFHIREIVGVRGVFAIDGVPLAVDEQLVGDLMSRCMRGAFNPPKPRKVQRGMRIVATSGPFKGAEGIVTVVGKRDTHAHVLMEVFEGTIPARIHVDDLVSVSYSFQRMIG